MSILNDLELTFEVTHTTILYDSFYQWTVLLLLHAIVFYI